MFCVFGLFIGCVFQLDFVFMSLFVISPLVGFFKFAYEKGGDRCAISTDCWSKIVSDFRFLSPFRLRCTRLISKLFPIFVECWGMNFASWLSIKHSVSRKDTNGEPKRKKKHLESVSGFWSSFHCSDCARLLGNVWTRIFVCESVYLHNTRMFALTTSCVLFIFCLFASGFVWKTQFCITSGLISVFYLAFLSFFEIFLSSCSLTIRRSNLKVLPFWKENEQRKVAFANLNFDCFVVSSPHSCECFFWESR